MNVLTISKLGLYGMFLNYYCYFILTGSFIRHGTIAFFALTLLGVFIDIANNNMMVYISDSSKIWVAYGLIAFATTAMTYGMSGVTSDIIKYFQRIMLIMCIAYICEQEKTIRFAVNLLAVTAIGCAGSILFTLGDYQRKLDLTSGANVSANDVGSIMAYGCFAVLFVSLHIFNGLLGDILKCLLIVAMIVVIFLAGSRKSIVAIVLFYSILIVLSGFDYLRKQPPARIILWMVIGIAVFFIAQRYLFPYATETNLYERIWGEKATAATASDQGRIELYKLALQEFWNHPFTGIGYNKFKNFHGLYSHSTYAEPLASSGIFGFLYLLPYANFVIRQINLIRITRNNPDECLWQKALLAFLVSFLFIGVGIPYIYKDVPCIILGMFVASQTLTIYKYRRIVPQSAM